MEMIEVSGPQGPGSLQSIVDRAQDDAVIHLGPGTYTGPVVIRRPVTLMGSEGAPLTIVDGARKGPAFTIEGEPANVTLCGLTIQGGTHGVGGGVAVLGMHEVTILNCVLRDNRAADVGGGAIYAVGGFLRIRDSEFRGNRANQGGALLLDEVALASVVNCLFLGNEANAGGAVRLRGGAVLACAHCTFADNTLRAAPGGPTPRGAVVCVSGQPQPEPRVRFANCLVWCDEPSGLAVDAAGSALVTVTHGVLPPTWQGAGGLHASRHVCFAAPARTERDGIPTLAPGAMGAGQADWALMLLADATNDLTGTPRLTDERVDPGAVDGE